MPKPERSTTVEIILYYLTATRPRHQDGSTTVEIILYYLTTHLDVYKRQIYNSRNYSILLNDYLTNLIRGSTTVEIILYYLTKSTERLRS